MKNEFYSAAMKSVSNIEVNSINLDSDIEIFDENN